MNGETPAVLLLDTQPAIVSLDTAKHAHVNNERGKYSIYLRNGRSAFELFDKVYAEKKTGDSRFTLAARLVALGVCYAHVNSSKFAGAAAMAISFLNAHGHRIPTKLEHASGKCIVDWIRSLRGVIQANDDSPLIQTLLAIVLARYSNQSMHIDVVFTPRSQNDVTFSHWQGIQPIQGWPMQSQSVQSEPVQSEPLQSQPSQVARVLLKCKELEEHLGQLILTLDGCDSPTRACIDRIFGFSGIATQQSATQDGHQSQQPGFLCRGPMPLRKQLTNLQQRFRFDRIVEEGLELVFLARNSGCENTIMSGIDKEFARKLMFSVADKYGLERLLSDIEHSNFEAVLFHVVGDFLVSQIQR